MMKKLASLVLALILMTAFYLYALLREDEATKGTDRWVVASEDTVFKAQGASLSAQPADLASAMGVPLPLPDGLTSGEVKDGSYHGYYVRILQASDGQRTVHGVRPASAASMLRGDELVFAQSDKTLMSYPLLQAELDGKSYYYLSTELAAFVIEVPAGISDDDALAGFDLITPK